MRSLASSSQRRAGAGGAGGATAAVTPRHVAAAPLRCRARPATLVRCQPPASNDALLYAHPAAAAPADAVASGSYASYEDASPAHGPPSPPAPLPPPSLSAESTRLAALARQLDACASLHDKVALLDAHADVAALRRHAAAANNNNALWPALDALPPREQYLLKLLPALGQGHVLAISPADADATAKALSALAAQLARVDAFYDCLGGLLGYQQKSLELIAAKLEKSDDVNAAADANNNANATTNSNSVTYHVPPGLDLAGEDGAELGARAAAQGLLALPSMAEILPVGGAGDRLGLRCDATGEALPAAMLPYAGRPILEWLLRDLQAREYLYWQLTGTQVTTPVAIMTSDAKGNHARIAGLLDSLGWMGRPRDAFRLFRQPLVPVVDSADGRWLLTAPLRVMAKPGGHGVIWKLMLDEGIFDWLASRGRTAALLRQVSNPMAGTDTTMLALAGTGYAGRHSFGFASCERAVGAAEGMNVLAERAEWVDDASAPGGRRRVYRHAITNVEYTEFERLGLSDTPAAASSNNGSDSATTSAYPANTNILYVGLAAARRAVADAATAGSADGVLPSLLFNLKKKVKFADATLGGVEREVRAGRMECTMQNLADGLVGAPSEQSIADVAGGADALPRGALSTFMVYNLRRKTTSSAKKARSPGSARIAQTPDGSFYDLQRNAWQLLQRCGLRYVPEVRSVEDYLARGPSFMFLFHPALGPAWDVIAQKLRGGALADGSELVLEVAEASLVDVRVDGSLIVTADAVMGHAADARAADAAPAGANGLAGIGGVDGFGGFANTHHSNGSGGGGVQGAGMLAAAAEKQQPQGAADASAPSKPPSRLCFSSRCGRVLLHNVSVSNAGVDWAAPGNVYWRHDVSRREACRVVLRGRSEFEARDVRIDGDRSFVVPDGYRMSVTAAPGGGLATALTPLGCSGDAPSWEWRYSMSPTSGAVTLDFLRHEPDLPFASSGAGASRSGAGGLAVYGLRGAAALLSEEGEHDDVLDFVI